MAADDNGLSASDLQQRHSICNNRVFLVSSVLKIRSWNPWRHSLLLGWWQWWDKMVFQKDCWLLLTRELWDPIVCGYATDQAKGGNCVLIQKKWGHLQCKPKLRLIFLKRSRFRRLETNQLHVHFMSFYGSPGALVSERLFAIPDQWVVNSDRSVVIQSARCLT